MITSKSNSIVKHISSLKIKKYRDINNQYLIEGIKMVREIINSEEIIPEFIVYSKEILKNTTIGNNFLKEFDKLFDDWIEVSKEVFEYFCDTQAPQGVLAVIKKRIYSFENLKEHMEKNSEEKYIVLENIQDQGNIGTIVRSATSFDVKNIICIEGTADVFSPKVVRSAMGCINKINIYITLKNEIDELLEFLEDSLYNLVSTSLDAKTSLSNHVFSKKDIFVFGNEANGVSEELQRKCNDSIKIEMTDNAESLNVAVAASVIMYNWYANRGE